MNILFFLTPKAKVSYVEETDSIRQVMEKMEHHGYTAIPLLGCDGQYIGTITEGNLLWEMKIRKYPQEHQLEKISIMEVPRKRDNQAVKVNETMENLFAKLMNQNFVPVVDDENIFIGIVTRKDLLLYLKDNVKSSSNNK